MQIRPIATPNSPFNSQEAGSVIMKFMSETVFPIVKEIQALSIEVADYRQGFLNSFNRRQLEKLDNKYRATNKKFLVAYHIFQTPDELFKKSDKKVDTTDPQIAGLMMGDYMRFSPSVKAHFDEGFRLLEVMERSLGRDFQSADQRVATTLSVIAITVTIGIALLGNPFAPKSQNSPTQLQLQRDYKG